MNNFPVDRGHLPRTINHEVAQCLAVVWGEARNEPRSRKLPQSDSEEEAQTEPQPKSQWVEPHPKRETNEPVVKRMKESNKGTRTARENIEDLEQW